MRRCRRRRRGCATIPTLFARLSSWRWSDADREPFGDIEDKDGNKLVDGVFTVCTVDNATYQLLPLRPSVEMSSEDAGSAAAAAAAAARQRRQQQQRHSSEVEACSEILHAVCKMLTTMAQTWSSSSAPS